LIVVELRPAAGPTHPGRASVVTVIALFVLLGEATLGMRWYFEQRAIRKAVVPTTVESVEPN
jgi:hypothetical protein